MKRYPAFDPPEYVTWRADPALVRAFRDTLTRSPSARPSWRRSRSKPSCRSTPA